MDCSEVKNLLSAYCDDELSSVKRTAVADHLAGCDDCARELAGFQSLSTLAAGMTHPEPPAQIWQELEEQLDFEHGQQSARPTFLNWLGWMRKPSVRFGLATAAAILIAVGWFGYANWPVEHNVDHQMAVVFGEYLEEFRRDPSAAQQILLANYEGQAVDADQALHTVGYRPAVAYGLPEGYAVEETYVMKMPCCACVQCLCQRSDGTTIAIFEHDDEEADWFGDRPQSEAICDGKRCSMVEIDDRLAATWRQGKRHITVVGARDAAEVERLVAWFDDRRRSLPQ